MTLVELAQGVTAAAIVLAILLPILAWIVTGKGDA